MQNPTEYRDPTLTSSDMTLTEIRYLHAGVWNGWTESGQSFTMARIGNELSVMLGYKGTVYLNKQAPRNLNRVQLLTLCGFRMQEQPEEEESA